MDKENTFTPEQLMDMVKNITSNAKIGQFIVENHGTVNYHEKSGEAPDDRHMRQVLQELMEAKDENGNKLMVEQQQWFAVYRVLVEYGNYPGRCPTSPAPWRSWAWTGLPLLASTTAFAKPAKLFPVLPARSRNGSNTVRSAKPMLNSAGSPTGS